MNRRRRAGAGCCHAVEPRRLLPKMTDSFARGTYFPVGMPQSRASPCGQRVGARPRDWWKPSLTPTMLRTGQVTAPVVGYTRGYRTFIAAALELEARSALCLRKVLAQRRGGRVTGRWATSLRLACPVWEINGTFAFCVPDRYAVRRIFGALRKMGPAVAVGRDAQRPRPSIQVPEEATG